MNSLRLTRTSWKKASLEAPLEAALLFKLSALLNSNSAFPEDAKKQRQELVKERKAKKDARAAAKDRDFPGAALINSVSRRRILNLDSDDDDSWDADGPDMEQHGILRGRSLNDLDPIREHLITILLQRRRR